MRTTGLRVAAVFVAGCVTLVATAVATADSLTLSTVPTQATDAGPVKIVASGSTVDTDPNSVTLYVTYRQAGAGGCASTPQTDSGSGVSPNGTPVGPGMFDTTSVSTATQFPIGSYLVCGWLYDNNTSTVAAGGTTSMQMTVTAADTLSLATPADAVEGAPLNITANGNAYDTNAIVDATVKPAPGTCAGAPPPADTGTPTIGSGSGVGGQTPYSAVLVSQQVFDAGSYLVCAWLVDQSTTQVLAAANAMLTVGALHASLQLAVPSRIDPGQSLAPSLTADVQAGIPVIADADVKPNRGGAHCAANPDAEPTSAVNVINASLTDTQQPSGAVTGTGSGSLNAPDQYLLCGWLLKGWTQSTNPPVVSGPVSAVVTVVAPQTFRGHTSQHRQISITVTAVERVISDIAYVDRLRCNGRAVFATGEAWNGVWNSEFTSGTLGTLHIGGSGRFSLGLDGNPAHTFDMKGKLTGKRLTGSFIEKGRAYAFTEVSGETARCTTGRVAFTAGAR
jgi:hypothetical protein